MADKKVFSVRRVTEGDVSAAGSLLARAFFDYPMWTWILPDDEHRRRALPVAMRQSLRWGMLMDETYIAGDPMQGVALWTPGELPDADLDPDGSKTGWPESEDALGADATARLELLVSTQRTLRARDIPLGAMYLAYLGVDPPAQRGGAGGALLRDMFARADAEGRAIYLETEKGANVAYYTRHGFEVLVEGVIPDGGPRFWTFLRTPENPAG